MGKCLECGKEFTQSKRGRKKLYCDRKCGDKAKHRSYLKQGKITKVCEYCGENYSARNKNQKYCSVSCGTKGSKSYEVIKNKEYIKSCKICKKEFFGTANSKFCSSECENSQYAHECEHCKTHFKSKQKIRMFCSKECAQEHLIKNECFCTNCGERFMGDNRRANKFCSRKCFYEFIGAKPSELGSESSGRYSGISHIKRAKKHGVAYEYIKPIDIYKRDNFKCGICNGDIDMNLPHPHPMSASIDHIIPISVGGTHTWDNVQSAHLTCNIKKSNKVGGVENGWTKTTY